MTYAELTAAIKDYCQNTETNFVNAIDTFIKQTEQRLYGCLVEAYTYMKGDTDLMQMYQLRYQEALGLLKTQAEGRMTRDEYRDGTIRLAQA
jgi:hypothetical protein